MLCLVHSIPAAGAETQAGNKVTGKAQAGFFPSRLSTLGCCGPPMPVFNFYHRPLGCV